MAGTLTISTLSDGTNSTSATNCIQGSAKAWVNFNGQGTVAIRASYNVSSITDNGTGDYTINFTNALVDNNYAIAGVTSAVDTIISWILSSSTRTTSSVRVGVRNGTNTAQDGDPVSVAIFR